MSNETERHAETVMVRGEHATRGAEGEKLLVNGQRMALRLWEHEKVGVGKSEHQNVYEYVAYVIKGAVRITMDRHSFEAHAGDSYCVPANTPYSLEIIEEATVVEATSPSDRGDVTPVE
ncbi:MAG: cupin domain-containing protein [Pyrinomonadaceae bacterium MAG19_C2-C3]|nr:cupin domain-containing protein [Pyrinomonadaceae bacterium MAG19_C2-C3]